MIFHESPKPRRYVLVDGQCQTCDDNLGRICPPHDASTRCESGGGEHCSCDRCF